MIFRCVSIVNIYVRATVKVAPTYMFDTQAFVGVTFTVALTYIIL
jgi:hypothetical protein